MVRRLNLKSREEWLTTRQSYIGGSDAACILGMNPWKTNVQLWEEKTGRTTPRDISDNPFVRYGTQAEEHLRALFELDFPQYVVEYVENNLWVNDKFPWAHASLDGWLTEKGTGRRGILEIKTTNIVQSMQKEKWRDKIPDNYYLQILHYLMVTEWDFVVLKAQLKFDYGDEIRLTTRHYTIQREEVEQDIEILMDAERTFVEALKTGKRPALILPPV